METLTELIEQFWDWAGISQSAWENENMASLSIEPFYFPKFDRMRNQCYHLVNTSTKREDIRNFLICMALDAEEEHILDYCKKYANKVFLDTLISAGIHFPQFEARWQIAELLKHAFPTQEAYLNILKEDNHPYVRKRARAPVQKTQKAD